MTAYIKKPTQEQRILDLLKERGSAGVKSWEIPNNLHILQYNARIYGLREKGFNIINKDETFYLITGEPKQESMFEYQVVGVI